MARLSSRALQLSSVFAAILLTACALVVALLYLGVIRFESQCDGYAPSELVLNCFEASDLRDPILVSPTGKLLVAGGYKKLTWIAHWDDKQRATVETQDLDFGETVESAAFSNDGARLAVYVRAPEEDTICLFDTLNRQLLKKWPTARSMYGIKLVFSDDGETLFTNPVERGDPLNRFAAITAWETSTGKLLGTIKTSREQWLGDFGFFQGRLLIAYERQTDYKEITICESAKPFSEARLVASIKAPGATSFDRVRFSPDGTRLAVSSHHAQPMRAYRVSDGQMLAELGQAYYGVTTATFPGFAFSRNGAHLAVSHSGGSATLWDISGARELGELGTLQGRRYNPMIDFVFGPDGKTLITRDYHAVVVWDISGFRDEDR
jgi:WD40 repeat protein